MRGPIAHRDAGARLATRTAPVAIRQSSITDAGTFEGYGSVFRTVDTFGDTVVPGAYAASLAAHRAAGTRPKLLWQHDETQPIGVWEEIVEDDVGLYCKGRLLLDLPKAREAHLLMKNGAIDGLSIGFQATEFGYVTPEEAGLRDAHIPALHSSGKLRAVTGIDLWEVSIVTFQSCAPATVTQVRQAAPPSVHPRRSQRPGADLSTVYAAIARRQALVARLVASR